MGLETKTIVLIIIVVLVSTVLGMFFISYSGKTIESIKDCKATGGFCTSLCKEGTIGQFKCDKIETFQTDEGSVITRYLPGKEPICCLSK